MSPSKRTCYFLSRFASFKISCEIQIEKKGNPAQKDFT